MSTNPSAPKFGVFAAIINLISVLPFGDKPVIFTRLKNKNGTEEWTHAIRLHNAQSIRIGMNELRGAFPKELAMLTDEQILVILITKKDQFIGRELEIEITPQLDKDTGKPVFDKVTKAQYFNVRLHSNVSVLSETDAAALVKHMFTASAASTKAKDAVKNIVSGEFGEKQKQKAV